MIIATQPQITGRIFDYVQTITEIADACDLIVTDVIPTEYGFSIHYKEYNGSWERRELKLYNSQILLLNSFIK